MIAITNTILLHMIPLHPEPCQLLHPGLQELQLLVQLLCRQKYVVPRFKCNSGVVVNADDNASA